MMAENKTDRCTRFTLVMADYLDRSLPAAQEHDFARHLEECDLCRDLLERTRTTLRLLGDNAEVEVPTELGWAVKRAVHRAARAEVSRSVIRPLPFAISAAAVAVLMVGVSLSGAPENTRGAGGGMLGADLQDDSSGPQRLERYVSPASVPGTFRLPPDAALADNPDSNQAGSPTRLSNGQPVKYPF